MSLIVAKKIGNDIHFYGDTKLTYPENEHPNQPLAAPKEGVIKICIINEQLCIAFAGEVDAAEQAIKYCRYRHDLTSHEIKDYLLTIVQKQNNKTEFILGIGFPHFTIYEIKNSVARESSSAWIGSQKGFNIFQENALDKNNTSKKPDTIICESLDYVIKSGNVPEVNGFIVHAANESGAFRYHGYMQTSIPPRTYTFKGSGGHILEVYGTAQEGGYSVSFCENEGRSDMAAIHVRQGEFGVLYELKNQALLWPTVINNVDEHEFNDILREKYNLNPPAIFSPLQPSLLRRGNKFALQKDFINALNFYNLGLSEKDYNLRPVLLFNKGITLLYLNRFNEACIELDKAVKLNPKFEKLAQEAIQSIYLSNM